MRIQLTTLVAILCFQIPAFSMFDCDCSWEIDMVCIETDDGTIVPFPNACWAECMGYEEEDFIDCNYDITYDPTCGCSFEADPVCVSSDSGEVILFPNSCWAECVGYNEDSFLDCNYDLPTDPGCGCSFEIDEVCVEVEADLFMPFPNACWANCLGYTEDQFVDCDEVSPEDLEDAAQYYYELIIGNDNNGGNIDSEDIQQLNTEPFNPPVQSLDMNNGVIIEQVSLYPNPTKDQVYVLFNLQEAMTIRMDILTSEGKVIRSILHQASEGVEVVNIEISDLPRGFYFLQIYAGRDMETLKFVKEE